MTPRPVSCLLAAAVALFLAAGDGYAQSEPTPLSFLKVWEWANRDAEGTVYLGKVITVRYEPDSVTPPESYHPYLLELTDVIKTPLRSSYRLVLKGNSDTSGDREDNRRLSRRRAETLRRILIEDYYMDGDRITAQGYGSADPVATNDTAAGRGLNRRVEIHVYGDVSRAVRFRTSEEDNQ